LSGIDVLRKDWKAQEYWYGRFVAFVVDAVIVFVILAIIAAVAAIPFLLFNRFAPFTWFFGTFSAFWGLILVFYFAVAESTSGTSFGKRIFSLRVVSKTGSTPTLAEAFVRNLSKIYWLLLLLDVIVGLAVSKNYQQKYSDQFIGTTVVRG
jgi:uncharacterized RDD family membrane protein YckC